MKVAFSLENIINERSNSFYAKLISATFSKSNTHNPLLGAFFMRCIQSS